MKHVAMNHPAVAITACPTCSAQAGQPCRALNGSGKRVEPHQQRVRNYFAQQDQPQPQQPAALPDPNDNLVASNR